MAWLLVADRPVSARSDSRASTADWSARLFKGALLAFVAALMSVLVVRSAKLPTSESAQRSELIYATTFGSRVSNFPHIATGRVPNTCYPGPVLLCTAERTAEELDTYSSGDDLFLYYIPVVARQFFGVQYPFVTITTFHMVETLISFALLLRACATQRQLRLWAMIAAAFFTVLFIYPEGSLIETSYYASIVACVSTAGLLFSLSRFVAAAEPPSWHVLRLLVTPVIFAVLVAFSVASRSSSVVSYMAGVGVALVLVLGQYVLHRSGPRRHYALVVAGALLIATYATPPVIIRVIVRNPAYPSGSQHAVWHTIWSALGMMPNPYGFEWSDTKAELYAQSVKPGVVPFSPEYEQILRDRVLEVFRQDPQFFVKWQEDELFTFNYWKNAEELGITIVVLVTLIIAGLYSRAPKPGLLLAATFVAACVAGFIPALLSSTLFPAYGYPAEAGIFAVAGLSITYFGELALGRIRALPRMLRKPPQHLPQRLDPAAED